MRWTSTDSSIRRRGYLESEDRKDGGRFSKIKLECIMYILILFLLRSVDSCLFVNRFTFLSYFEKNSSYVSGVSLCIFASLWLCLFGCVLQGPIRLKVLWGTILGTNEILAPKHWIATVKVNQGYFKPPFLFFTILSSFTRLKVFRSIAFKHLHNPNAEYTDAAV